MIKSIFLQAGIESILVILSTKRACEILDKISRKPLADLQNVTFFTLLVNNLFSFFFSEFSWDFWQKFGKNPQVQKNHFYKM